MHRLAASMDLYPAGEQLPDVQHSLTLAPMRVMQENFLEMKEALKLRERIAEIYAQRTGNPTSIISRDMTETFLSARQARIYGIIDDIEFSDDEEFLRLIL
nr:clp protease proteolytic subunit [Ipomoea trifida]